MREPLVIELDYIPPKEVRGNSRAHHMVKHRASKKLRNSGYNHAVLARSARMGDGWTYWHRGRVTFAFHHWRKIDLDNLIIGMKPFVDGLVDSKLFRNDEPDHVVYGAHTFALCKKGESRTIVTIEELT